MGGSGWEVGLDVCVGVEGGARGGCFKGLTVPQGAISELGSSHCWCPWSSVDNQALTD